MTSSTIQNPLPLPSETPRRISSPVLGTMVFVATEVMFFSALMSSHTIARATALGGVWPPAGQPRLPIEQTALNSIVLLASGAVLWFAGRALNSGGTRERALRAVAASIGLGVLFVVLQGREWVALIREGLTLTSSTHGAFFYVIVGAHAAHVLIAVAIMLVLYSRLKRAALSPDAFAAARLYWYFVVLLWPVLYLKVYL